MIDLNNKISRDRDCHCSDKIVFTEEDMLYWPQRRHTNQIKHQCTPGVWWYDIFKKWIHNHNSTRGVIRASVTSHPSCSFQFQWYSNIIYVFIPVHCRFYWIWQLNSWLQKYICIMIYIWINCERLVCFDFLFEGIFI